ncbi:related to tRNA (guanine-N(7)-)-methyltransferase subunit trm82 [Phialocephala subalpina]|uniref:Related to tRNA (Guanine-N(7)-)-methyltransferase subunit trm82 n=1 Tax=Phialocephala subalpina TaxID=576137 RepID=A0A1L7WD26_9HELO|nr:related to tRNA (guanine-N(7)-)-methyltransferase subunit trm82 [Phialocephala subalpina]
MRMPYQCMTRCGDILVAARGSSIDSFRFQDGSLLSTWKPPSSQDGQGSKAPETVAEITTKLDSRNSESSVEIALDAASPPAKKRKLSKSEESPGHPERKNGKKKQNNRASALSSGLETLAVIILASTTDGRHVIAVTGEDKSIRVFENVVKDGTQELKQLSQRAMPKRPCALVISSDNSTIISADKFGDVYALPLFPSANYIKSQGQTLEPAKPFVPAANELTIHSQRNRKALENQKKHTNKVSEKTELSFEHRLLLGHVSLLTHLILVTSAKKDYIITADRDEHIRISRGIPQTHIIEGFCLGHTEFVSRLCIPRNRPDILISAGGDDEIFVWDWKSGELISRTNLTKHVEALKKKLGGAEIVDESIELVKVAVSGLYHTRAHVDDHLLDFIIVTCEGIPALFSFHLHLDGDLLQDPQIVELPGNPLAVLTDIPLLSEGSTGDIVVSIDTVHLPGSTTVLRSEPSGTEKCLMIFHHWDVGLVPSDAAYTEPVEDDDSVLRSGEGIGWLSNLLYNLENLRKRDGDGQDA